MNILYQIAEERKCAVAAAKSSIPLSKLEPMTRLRRHHSLKEALETSRGTCIIAEIKKASPSAGLIKPDFAPSVIAREYLAAGAKAISVLTEPNHFLGTQQHLEEVRNAVALPLLRKDFIVDPYQVTESAAWGADVILLIAAILEQPLMRDLYQQALELSLDVLVESHSESELEAALELPEAIIGINNRNLKTLQTDLNISRSLARLIPKTRLSVSESGISKREEIEELSSAGFSGFLIGESLLKGKLILQDL